MEADKGHLDFTIGMSEFHDPNRKTSTPHNKTLIPILKSRHPNREIATPQY